MPPYNDRYLELIREEYGEQLWDVVPHRLIVRQAEGAHAPVRAMGRDGRDVADIYDRVAGRVLAFADLSRRGSLMAAPRAKPPRTSTAAARARRPRASPGQRHPVRRTPAAAGPHDAVLPGPAAA